MSRAKRVCGTCGRRKVRHTEGKRPDQQRYCRKCWASASLFR